MTSSAAAIVRSALVVALLAAACGAALPSRAAAAPFRCSPSYLMFDQGAFGRIRVLDDAEHGDRLYACDRRTNRRVRLDRKTTAALFVRGQVVWTVRRGGRTLVRRATVGQDLGVRRLPTIDVGDDPRESFTLLPGGELVVHHGAQLEVHRLGRPVRRLGVATPGVQLLSPRAFLWGRRGRTPHVFDLDPPRPGRCPARPGVDGTRSTPQAQLRNERWVITQVDVQDDAPAAEEDVYLACERRTGRDRWLERTGYSSTGEDDRPSAVAALAGDVALLGSAERAGAEVRAVDLRTRRVVLRVRLGPGDVGLRGRTVLGPPTSEVQVSTNGRYAAWANEGPRTLSDPAGPIVLQAAGPGGLQRLDAGPAGSITDVELSASGEVRWRRDGTRRAAQVP